MALAVIRTVATWLPRAVADGSDLEARSQLLMASHLAGIGQASGTGRRPGPRAGARAGDGRTAAARHRARGGDARGARFYLGVRDRELALVGVALGVAGPRDPEADAARLPSRVSTPLLRAVGQRRTLAQLGFTPDQEDRIVQDALDDPAIDNSPRCPIGPRWPRSSPRCGRERDSARPCLRCRPSGRSTRRSRGEQDGRPVVYLDGPGGTQVPQRVIDAVAGYYRTMNANDGGAVHDQRSDRGDGRRGARRGRRPAGAAVPDQIHFGANMTTLTFHVSRSIGATLGAGDEIVVTTLDHEANVSPWRALAADRDLVVRTVDIRGEDGTLDLEQLAAALGPRTRLVAVGYGSNALGTINPVAAHRGDAPMRAARWTFVDAVHYVPHGPSTSRRWAPTSWSRRPTSGSGRTSGVLSGGRGCPRPAAGVQGPPGPRAVSRPGTPASSYRRHRARRSTTSPSSAARSGDLAGAAGAAR